jgi:hypothetical protein
MPSSTAAEEARAVISARLELHLWDQKLLRGIELAYRKEGFRVRVGKHLFTPDDAPQADGRHGWLGLPLLRARLADWRRIEAGEVGKGSLEKYRGELEGLDLIEVPESILRWMKEWTPKRWLTSRIEAAEKDLKMLTKVSESSRRSPGRSVNVAIHGLENDLGHLYFALWWKWLGEKHRSDRVERVAGRYGRGRGR